MGAESFQKNMEKGLIEVAPLAYMRGRTLDNAFIILDEAMQVLKKVDGISFCELTSKDVVRHPLVQKIVQAYDEYEKKAKPENHSGRAKSTTRKRRENK